MVHSSKKVRFVMCYVHIFDYGGVKLILEEV